MSLFEDTNPHALHDLLTEIYSRTMALPDFQRDFVWDPSATQELILSIAYNYPAGSLLRVRDASRLFAAREFQGAPPLDGHHHTFLVLDGQQRLTSLYQAFYGVGEHRYYIKLKNLLEGSDLEEAIIHQRATSKRASRLEDFEVQAAELIIPLSELQRGVGMFGRWSRKVARRLDGDERIQLEDGLAEVEERWIKPIENYRFPVVTLSDKTEPDALCTIFETLNRTGVKLGPFELLTARFWPQKINLRELWATACETHATLGDFEVNPYYVLQAIALVCREVPSCKRSDVLNLTPDHIRKWWDRAVRGLALGLEMLRDDCQVMLPKWLPYQTMLPPLGAILAACDTPKSALAGSHRERIKRWFWCAVFGQAYESSPNSQSARDVQEVGRWLSGGDLPETVAAVRFDPQALHDVTPRQRSVYRGTICLVLGMKGGARDFHTQAVITGKLMTDQNIDDHHIFPAKYLERQGVAPARKRDCVLNRTLIDRTTNQMINDRAPSKYMADIRSTPGFPFESVLKSHTLPAGDDSPFWSDNYEAFLTWRQDQLWEGIKHVTGLTEASDLEDEGVGG